MKFSFRARIFKVGINPCVKVPRVITSKMTPTKGYIPIKGTIVNYPFEQTLVPVKDSEYRLYVNGIMLKGSGAQVGDTVKFSIEQTAAKRKDGRMLPELKRELASAKLSSAFKLLTPSRQKEILRYLNYLKTKEARDRNIKKVLDSLRSK